jgi:hypothetical protein
MEFPCGHERGSGTARARSTRVHFPERCPGQTLFGVCFAYPNAYPNGGEWADFRSLSP